MKTNFFFLSSIEKISKDEWNQCSGTLHPFTSYDFFYALEKSGSAITATGWEPHHYIQKNEKNEIIAVCPLYIKTHSFGEYIFDHAWANAYHKHGLNYYPKLQSAVPFTPVSGNRILINKKIKNVIKIKNEVVSNIIAHCNFKNISSVHFNFVKKNEIRDILKKNLLLRKGIQFHWHNDNYSSFEDFLSSLTSRKRKLIKKERKCVIDFDLQIEILSNNQIKQNHWDFFYECYINTSNKKWGSSYLKKKFFYLIGKNLKSKTILILAKKHGEYIAGALNFLGKSSIYGRLWGSKKFVPYLHFEICYYQAIEYAIKNKINTVEAGAQGPHKLQRGYKPTETFSLHWIKENKFKNAISNYLNEEMKIIENEKKDLQDFVPYKKLN